MVLSSNALIVRLFPSLEKGTSFKFISLAIIGTALLTLSAKVTIPLYPVQISMQSFVVILLGCMFGSRLALATVLLYLLEGAMGLPVFQGTPARGIGLLYMIGPTGGYLLGFLAAAYIVGHLSERGLGRSVSSAAALFLIGAVIIDIPGVTWLASLLGLDGAKSVYLSYQYAFWLKTGLGAVIVPLIWHFTIKADETP